MGLVAGTTVESDANLGDVRWIHLITDWVPLDWMAQAVLDRDHRYRAEVPFRQFHAAIEDRDDVRIRDWRGLGTRPVALETEAVDGFRAKQMLIFATVRLVTSAAALPEGRLVQVFLFVLLRLFFMAAKAGINRIRTHISGGSRPVRVMAVDALPLSSRMLDRRAFDLPGSFFVA